MNNVHVQVWQDAKAVPYDALGVSFLREHAVRVVYWGVHEPVWPLATVRLAALVDAMRDYVDALEDAQLPITWELW